MQKVYLLPIVLLWCLASQAQTAPISLNCVQDVKLNTDTFGCSRPVYGIDPILPFHVSRKRVRYYMEGATEGKGVETASGNVFNAGITKVTYILPTDPELTCSFTVTLINTNSIYPQYNELPVLEGNCSVSVDQPPVAINKCTGEKILAVTYDSLNFNRPGKYIINWKYLVDDVVVLAQEQSVVVHEGGFVPLMDTLPGIQASCSAQVTDIPQGYNKCTGEQISAVTKDPLVYKKPGQYIITWIYLQNDQIIYRQNQQVTVYEGGKLIPDAESLQTITGSCFVEVKNTPTARNNCTGAVVTGIPLDPLKYDIPGWYKLHWMYIDGRDTVTQVQLVNVIEGGKLVPDNDALPTISGSCSVRITNVPTATNNCNGKTVKATTKDPLSYNKPGKYKINWMYVYKEDTLRQTQILKVTTGEFLIADSDTLPDIIGSCSATIRTIPTAHDNCNNKLITGTTKDPLFYDKPGVYKITWTFESDSTVKLVQQQVVRIEHSRQLTPNLVTLPDLTGDCSVDIKTPPTATDLCSGQVIAAVTNDPLVYTDPGRYTVRWEYKSKNQNSLIQTQTVIISAGNRIVPEKESLPNLQGFCSVVVNDIPSARDRCTGKLIKAISRDSLNYNTAGKYSIRWIYIDGRDTLIQTQSVVVESNGTLIPQQVLLPILKADCQLRVNGIPSSINSCSKRIIKATTKDPLFYDQPGEYTIHWLFTEGADTVRQTQIAVVNNKAMTLKVYPNPTNNEFRIIAESCNPSDKLTLRVFDPLGRLMEVRVINFNQEVRFGSRYPGSTYFAQIIQGEKRSMYKLIKAR